MINKFINLFIISIFSLTFQSSVTSEEFIFEVSDLEIIENGTIYKGNNRGKVKTNNQLQIIANKFEYQKKINRLEAYGEVQLTDFKNNIIIDAEKIFYLKNEEKIYTLGKTLINVSDKYIIEGHDLILLKNQMLLSSYNKAIITDNDSNIYKLEQFEYLINQEILKGEKITVTTNYKENNSDQYYFETGFFNLKEDTFLAKDINVKLHKTLFGNNQNDPRINAISAYGDKFNKNFDKGVFTSCKKTDKCPPWKIRAKKIHHDKVEKQVNYKNAWLELYDFPVFYFPKFFHPDPSVKRQSGILPPEIGNHETLGDSVYLPYFYVISDNKDITIKPRLFNDNKFILQNEYRQKTKNSLTIIDTSFVKGHDSNLNDKGDSRSHFFANSQIDLNFKDYINSDLKIRYEKTSNDTYLKLFNFIKSPLLLDRNDVLESTIKLDLEHENYDLTTSLEMYETLSGSNSDRYQYVLPSYDFSKNFNLDNLNGSFNFNSTGNNTLRETNISASILSNNLNYSSYDSFFTNGVKSNFEVTFKNINTVGKNNAQYKNSPQSEIMSSYNYNLSLPLAKKNENSINTLIPKISFRLSPHEMKNNSDTGRRINIDNIFNNNRLSLIDSFEGGESVTLGIDFAKEKINVKNKITEIQEYFDIKFATVLRLNEEKNIPTNSTLNKKMSNIFGQLNFKTNEIFSLNYDFSLTDDLNTFEYNSINANFNFNDFSTKFTYLEERGNIGNANVIENKTKYEINDYNSILFGTRRNRSLNLTEYYDLVYEYKNDCLVAGIKYKKDYYNDADIKPKEELFFSVTIVPFYTFSPDKMILNKNRQD
jgi:LPS-assembly protein